MSDSFHNNNYKKCVPVPGGTTNHLEESGGGGVGFTGRMSGGGGGSGGGGREQQRNAAEEEFSASYPHLHLIQSGVKCSADFCPNENMVMSQAAEIERLRKQIKTISRERDGLTCEVHHLRMEILAMELGRLDSSLVVDDVDVDEDTLAEDDGPPRDDNNDDDDNDSDHISGSHIGTCVDDDVKLSTYSSSEMTRMSSSSSSSSASSSPVLFTSSQSSSSQFHDSAEESGDTGVVERRYGGPPARDAALVIQRAFRRYSMVKEFHRIKERRLSRRINNNVVARTPGTNGCEICIDLHESREEGLEVEDDDDHSSSCLQSSACADVTEVQVEVDHQHTSSTSTSSSSSLGHHHHHHLHLHQGGHVVPSPQGLTPTSSTSSTNNTSSSSVSSSQSSKLHNNHNNSDGSSSSHRNIHLHHHHQQQPPILHHHPMQLQQQPHHHHQIRHHIPSLSQQQQKQQSPMYASAHSQPPPQLLVQQQQQQQLPQYQLGGKVNSSTSSLCTSSGSPKSQSHHQAHMGVICQQVMSDAECEIVRKRLYRVGLNLFNKKPEVGITYLVKKKFLEGSASAVARFLISRKGLSKQMIGEYLANLQSPFSMACLEHFANEIDLSSMPIDLALRRFQSYLRMPGEAQKIERVMESFSRRYAACNPNITSNYRQGADTVFVMAFAIIMLNTDLHTPHLKADRRMKMEDFIKNLRGIDEGADIEREDLVGIYERIKQTEYKTGSDHVTQVMKVQQTIVGKKPNLALPHRRLVCYCRLYEVTDTNKREKVGSHQREVFLFNDLLVLTKILHKKRNSVTYSFRQSYPLAGIHLVLFANQYFEFGLSLRRGEHVLLNLNARNESDRAKFTEDLREAIAESDEMTRIESLSGKENRDSGVDVGKIKRFSNSLLDINDQCKPTRRGSCGSLDSGMSISFHSDEHQQQQQQQQQQNQQQNGHLTHHLNHNQSNSLNNHTNVLTTHHHPNHHYGLGSTSLNLPRQATQP